MVGNVKIVVPRDDLKFFKLFVTGSVRPSMLRQEMKKYLKLIAGKSALNFGLGCLQGGPGDDAGEGIATSIIYFHFKWKRNIGNALPAISVRF